MSENSPSIENRLHKNGHATGNGTSANEALDSGIEQTLPVEPVSGTGLLANEKQLADVKFAMSIVASGKMSESELAASLVDWTAFGSRSLADHLVATGKIQQREVDTLKILAEQKETQDSESCSSVDYHPESSLPGETREETVPQQSTSQQSTVNERRSAEGKSPGESAAGISLELSHFARTLGLGQTTELEESQVRRVSAEYRLIRKLGQGGLGSVWLARDEVLDRSVAIKELTDDRSSQVALDRFRREARLTGQLDHPNIVTVHQYGSDEFTGKAFYSMRFVGKKTLADAITEYHDLLEAGQGGVAQLNQILSAFQTVCQAIAFAHSRGVVHRDLKPENIALDNFGQVSVIDWGLAKSFNEPEYFDATEGVIDDSLSMADQTMAGQIVGTPLFMSPEQAAGRIDEIDERTDIYGLGAILFNVLTGRPPHLPGSYQSGDSSRVENILDSIMDDPSPSVLGIRPDAPAELATICARAMARKKSRRYATATDFADAVKGWVDGIADRTRRFELLKSQAREIEMRVDSTAEAISRDARFASSLPPIQGIIDSLQGRDQQEALEQWRSRLESIFTAVLRTDPNLHSLGFAKVSEEEVLELVRVQRNAGDSSFINCVPRSRLVNIQRTVCFDRLQILDPGDVDLSIRPCETQKRQAVKNLKRLSAWTPIFDQVDGQLFGVVSIEVDLESVISEYLQSLENVSNSIYVLDANDNLWISRHEKSQCSIHQRNSAYLTELCPELSEIFDGTRQLLELESKLVARRVDFGLPGLGFELYVVCIV